ncbi:MAG: short chain dehydrogenase [Methanobacteriota archaeon]|nr:MAG: short chain dehydrogenase [Euryarchaeota archaeon]
MLVPCRATMDRTALVTGGAKRIGKEICLRLANDGLNVAVHHRDSDSESLTLVEEINSMGVRAASFQCDLSQSGGPSKLFEECNQQIGPITDLVNNASLFSFDDIQSVDEKKWDLHMSVNARAQIMLIKHLSLQTPRLSSGSVVNILDQKIASPNPDYLSYTASRFAMLGMTESLARALAPSIRVNSVAPGHTLPSPDQSEEGFSRAQNQSPLGFGPGPKDIADAVSYLMHSRAVTGQVLFVDSGERFLGRRRDVVFETE